MKQMVTMHKRQHGAVAIMVGLTIFVLLLFLGMTVDLGRLFVTKTELSNAADACALAAASQLDGAADSLQRAVNAGIEVGTRNKVGFQGAPVTIHPDDIWFSEHLASGYQNYESTSVPDPTKMKYAKCELEQTGIIPAFMRIANIGSKTVASLAVASLAPGITNCGLPIAICQNKNPVTCVDGSAPDAMGLCKKEWVCSKFAAGNAEVCTGSGLTGNFNWIDYNPGEPTPGCPGGGASELACIIEGTGQCNLNYDTKVGQTGDIQSLAKSWNTRFGLYKGGSYGVPDATGFSYTPTSWPSKYNAYKGASANGAPNLTTARSSHLIYQNETAPWPDGPVINPTGYTNSTSADLAASDADRRLAVVPVVDCGEWPGSQTATIQKFACILMLHPMDDPGDPLYLEYEGLSDSPGNPCGTIGVPGGPGSVGPKVPTLVR